MRASRQFRCGLHAPCIDDGYPLSPKPSRARTQRQGTKRRTTTSAKVPLPSQDSPCDTPPPSRGAKASPTAPPTAEPPPRPAQSRRPSCQTPAAGPHAASSCGRAGGERLPRILAFPRLQSSVVPSETQSSYRKAQKSGVCIQGVLVSAFHVFPPYPRHRRPLTGMRNGLLKASVRSQPASEPLAPSARSLTFLRMQADTPQTAFAIATTAIMTPLSHPFGVPHRTKNPSHRPSDRRTATAAGPITPAVVPGSRRRPACNIPLRADRRPALTADLDGSASSVFRVASSARKVRCLSSGNVYHGVGKRWYWLC